MKRRASPRTKRGTRTPARRRPAAAGDATPLAASPRRRAHLLHPAGQSRGLAGPASPVNRRPPAGVGRGLQVGLDERGQVAVEDAVRVARLEPGAVVLDHPIRVQHVRADLASPLDRLLVADALLFLGPPLVERLLVEPGPQHAHRHLAVAALAALVLARHDDPGRQVRDAHGRVGHVDVLAAGARSTGTCRRAGPCRRSRSRCPRRSRARRTPKRTTCGAAWPRRTARCARAGGRPSRSSGNRTRGRRRREASRSSGPASSPSCRSISSTFQSRASANRMYMRRSISAQSCDSVPPAPEWIVTQAFFASSGVPIFTESSSSSANAAARAAGVARVGLGRLPFLQKLRERLELPANLVERGRGRDPALVAPGLPEDLLRFRLARPEIRRRGLLPQTGERAPRRIQIKGSRGARPAAPRRPGVPRSDRRVPSFRSPRPIAPGGPTGAGPTLSPPANGAED